MREHIVVERKETLKNIQKMFECARMVCGRNVTRSQYLLKSNFYDECLHSFAFTHTLYILFESMINPKPKDIQIRLKRMHRDASERRVNAYYVYVSIAPSLDDLLCQNIHNFFFFMNCSWFRIAPSTPHCIPCHSNFESLAIPGISRDLECVHNWTTDKSDNEPDSGWSANTTTWPIWT